MALARLALRNLQQRASPSSSFQAHNIRQRWNDEVLKRFMATSSGGSKVTDDKKQVSVSEGEKKSRLSPRRRHQRSLWNWRNKQHDYAPSLYGISSLVLFNSLVIST